MVKCIRENMCAKPFIKWVGGKTQLIPEISQRYPESITRYCEPFVGGGAILFDVLQKFHPQQVCINDINPELVNLYKIVKHECNALVFRLFQLQTEYLTTPIENRNQLYLEKRQQFNNLIMLRSEQLDVEKAALFIYLNKTCFNGLYRVNSQGLFNVPFNRAVNPAICDEENLHECSLLLQNVEIRCGNYLDCDDFITPNTFVYIDPPYRPLSKTSSFTSYTVENFNDARQIELGNFITQIANRGALIVASNADPQNENINDNFFDELYEGFNVQRVQASRMINSNARRRGVINEILITNMQNEIVVE